MSVGTASRRKKYSDLPRAETEANAVERARALDRAVDGALADSFPASDPPPWTLGILASVSERRGDRVIRRKKFSRKEMVTDTVERQPIHRDETLSVAELLARVRSEYLEMPGLKLTEAQARRLWTLDSTTCRVVLATLVERGFLKRSAKGHYVRAR